jgi:tungstate transport system substrate-binding protein
MPSRKVSAGELFPSISVVLALVIVLVLVLANSGHSPANELVLATTTSTYDSGLLDRLIPIFEAKYDVEVKVIAVGTGQALELGRAGNADALLVHAPDMEMNFIEGGHGLYRRQVMHNGFLIVGPPSDPADIQGLASASEAFRRVSRDTSSSFCSRGDDSGTHSREQKLWNQAGLDYDEISSKGNSDWYLSLGQGMGDTLRMASDLKAYTLTDEGTYYSMADELELKVLVSGGEELRNQYSVIPVNGSAHRNVNQDLAETFSEWLCSEECQDLIDEYYVKGRRLFVADALEIID